MSKVYIAMENTYSVEDGVGSVKEFLAAGLLGVFYTKEKAVEVIVKSIKELGCPDYDANGFEQMDVIFVDEDGRWIDIEKDYDNIKYCMQFICKETELNQDLTEAEEEP